MGGVDTADQLRTSYSPSLSGKKWWRQLFFWAHDTAVTNAFALWKDAIDPACSQLLFREMVIDVWLKSLSVSQSKRKARTQSSQFPRKRQKADVLPLENHSLLRNAMGKGNRVSRRRCQEWSKKGLRKNSQYHCPSCKVGLCPECFSSCHDL